MSKMQGSGRGRGQQTPDHEWINHNAAQAGVSDTELQLSLSDIGSIRDLQAERLRQAKAEIKKAQDDQYKGG
jgi:hypothetical protein